MNKENKKAEETVQMIFKVRKEDKIEIKRVCAIEDISMSAFIREAIAEKLHRMNYIE